jgi:hypothetical protein
MKHSKVSTKSPKRLTVGDVSRQIARDTLKAAGISSPFFRYCVASADAHTYPDLRGSGCSFSAHAGPWDFQPLLRATRDAARAKKLARLAGKSDRYDLRVRRGQAPSKFDTAVGESRGIRSRPENRRATNLWPDPGGFADDELDWVDLVRAPDPRGGLDWEPASGDRKKWKLPQGKTDPRGRSAPIYNPVKDQGTSPMSTPQRAQAARPFGKTRKEARREFIAEQTTKARERLVELCSTSLAGLQKQANLQLQDFLLAATSLKSVAESLREYRDTRLDAIDSLVRRIKAETKDIFDDVQVIYDRVKDLSETGVPPPSPRGAEGKKPAPPSTQKVPASKGVPGRRG